MSLPAESEEWRRYRDDRIERPDFFLHSIPSAAVPQVWGQEYWAYGSVYLTIAGPGTLRMEMCIECNCRNL